MKKTIPGIIAIMILTIFTTSCRNSTKPSSPAAVGPDSSTLSGPVKQEADIVRNIYRDKTKRILLDESMYRSPVPGVGFPDMDSMVLGEDYHKKLAALNLPYCWSSDDVSPLTYDIEDYHRHLRTDLLYSHRASLSWKNDAIGFTEYNGINRSPIDISFVIDGKFPTNGPYQFLTGIFNTEFQGISFCRFYYTYTYDGKLIDMLPTFYTRLCGIMTESEVLPDLSIRKTSIQVDRVGFTMPDTTGYTLEDYLMESPIDDSDNYNDTLLGRRIDSYYQLTPDGRFELRRQLEYPRREYTITQLNKLDSLNYVNKRTGRQVNVIDVIPQDSSRARWTLDMDRRYLPPGGRHNRTTEDLTETGSDRPDIRYPLQDSIPFDTLFLGRIGWAQLPFYADTAGVPPSRWYRDRSTVSPGRPSVDLSDFPSIAVDEFGQAIKTGLPDTITSPLIRLDYLLPSNGPYLFVYGTYGTPREPYWGYYATFDPNSGRLIDHLLAKEWGMGMTTLESEVSTDLRIRTTQINFFDTYRFSTPGQPLRGQRIDRYYRLTPEGKFEPERTDRYSVRPYDITELEHTRLYETAETPE